MLNHGWEESIPTPGHGLMAQHGTMNIGINKIPVLPTLVYMPINQVDGLTTNALVVAVSSFAKYSSDCVLRSSVKHFMKKVLLH